MSGTGAGYVRVYHTIVDDERFADVFHSPVRLGTWLQLLLLADALYPASAPLPPYANRQAVKALVDCGLIELADHGQYRVHGLASERAKRSQTGRNGAAMRWHSDGTAESMHPRAEPNRAEPGQSQSDFRRRVEATTRRIAELRTEPA
jgi:hypothetical protein